MKKVFAFLAGLTICVSALADEGMWLLPVLKQTVGKDLRAAGCRLTPDEIYSVNHSSLKDAIVQFGGGCTAEVISSQGLLSTNHHCGYSSIQGLSDDEHNYLMDGFWALDMSQEIPVPGLSVTFMISMEDVTAVITAAEDRKAATEKLEEEASNPEEGITASVTSFYNNNVFYLIKYRTFNDIRFVGAPPASMGKFGGETDNWMWPRHTCDFSMFRIWASPDNKPAEYSADNVPYQSERSLKISLKGVKENDYAMVLGYPGRTQRFQTAAELKQMLATNRVSIDARTVRQDVMWEFMCADPSIQLKYADKYASSANGWKKWQGEELAFKNLGIIERELAKETALKEWIEADPARKELYGDPVATIAKGIEATSAGKVALYKVIESPFSIELIQAAANGVMFDNIMARMGTDTTSTLQTVKESLADFYKDYVPEVDAKIASAILEHYRKTAAPEDYPQLPGLDFATMDIPAYVDSLYSNSIFTSYDKVLAASFEQFTKEDPACALTSGIYNLLYKYISFFSADTQPGVKEARKSFAAALLEWQKDKPQYPDANFTMRLTFGHVLPYSPKDGLQYNYFTTLKGVMEKEDPTNPEFIVPEGLKALYQNSDFGRWADKDGTLHTCFLTNNDITGGNSGSPVLNAKGELIGLAFDGNWESMSSDVMFEPDLQRCICVDIRFVLFTVEKLGGASNIISELSFAK